MKLLCSIVLAVCALPAFSQQPTNPQGTPPNGVQAPNRQIPPDTKAPAPGQISSADIQSELQKEFGRAALLKGQQLKAAVDDKTIVLTGTVETQEQHDLALRLAQQYASDRKIQDQIIIRQKT